MKYVLIGFICSLVFLSGCGASKNVFMLRDDVSRLSQKLDEYTLLLAKNQAALGALLEERHMLLEQTIEEQCKPRVF